MSGSFILAFIILALFLFFFSVFICLFFRDSELVLCLEALSLVEGALIESFRVRFPGFAKELHGLWGWLYDGELVIRHFYYWCFWVSLVPFFESYSILHRITGIICFLSRGTRPVLLRFVDQPVGVYKESETPPHHASLFPWDGAFVEPRDQVRVFLGLEDCVDQIILLPHPQDLILG